MSTVDPLTQNQGSGTPQGAPSASSQFNPAELSGTGTGTGVYNPGTITSPYESNPGSQYQTSQIVLGQQLAGMLGMASSANKPVTISSVLAHFQALSSQQQIPIERLLLDGHFYIDTTTGEPLSTPPPFGSSDPENLAALSTALLDTYNSNQQGNQSTLSSKIISGAQSGAAAQPLAPSPILGGGQTYQVELTSPQDLYDQLYTTFETNLGRAPTQKELNAFVNVFEGEQSKYQNSLNYQQEQMSRAKFSDQERQRNIELGYTQTPSIASGNLPNGPFHSAGAWANAFLGQVLGAPVTQTNVSLILTMINRMGGWANAGKTFNPMGSAVVLPGGAQTVGPKGANPNAPATYSGWGDGMLATLEGLSRANYGQLLSVLQSGKSPSKAQLDQINQELNQWSGGKIKSLPKPDAGTTAVAEQVAASASKAASAYNIKQGQPPTPQQSPDYTGKNFGPPATGFPGAPVPSKTQQSGGRAMQGVYGGPQEPPTTPTATPPNPTAPNATTTTTAPPQTTPVPTQTPTATPATQPDQQKVQRAQAAHAIAQQAQQDAQDRGAARLKGRPKPPPPKPWTPPAQVQNAPYTGNTVSPLNLQQGQNQYSTGDIYQGASTLEAVQPPSATGAAFTEATTGANAVPYLGYQYLQAFGAIANMIASGRAA